MPQHQRSTPFELPSFANDLLRSFGRINDLRAGDGLGTAQPQASVPLARPTVIHGHAQSEADIRRGHAERREMLARRRAEQQLTLALQSASALGVRVSVEQIVNLVVDTVDDVRACSRR